MQNLSFLKGLFVGIAIATVGAVAYANSVSSSKLNMDFKDGGVLDNSWVVLEETIYYCWLMGGDDDRESIKAQCKKVPMVGAYDPISLKKKD